MTSRKDELYNQSLGGSYPKDASLDIVNSCFSTRVYNALSRAGFRNKTENGKWVMDLDKVYGAVIDGTIWNHRGIGESAVKQICRVLADKGY